MGVAEVARGIESEVGNGVLIAHAGEGGIDLVTGHAGLNGNRGGRGVFFSGGIGQAGFEMNEIDEGFDDTSLGQNVGATVDFLREIFEAVLINVRDGVVFEVVGKFGELDAFFDGFGVEIEFVDLVEEFVAGGVFGDFVGTAVLVGIGAFGGKILGFAVT